MLIEPPKAMYLRDRLAPIPWLPDVLFNVFTQQTLADEILRKNLRIFEGRLEGRGPLIEEA
jgi:hypothetical protein